MKTKYLIFITALISCLLVDSAWAYYTFENDDPIFATKGKFVRPLEIPTSVTYYPSGRVKSEFYVSAYGYTSPYGSSYGTIITYKDESGSYFKGTRLGRVESVIIQENPLIYHFYAFQYYDNSVNKGNQIMSVTYTENYMGDKKVWQYNSNGTLKSYDSYFTTGMNYGHKMLLGDHADYSYVVLRGGKIEGTRTTTHYVYTYVQTGPGTYEPRLASTKTTTDTCIFSAGEIKTYSSSNNIIVTPSSAIGADEVKEKIALQGEMVDEKQLPAGVKIDGNMAGQESKKQEKGKLQE